ncbi:50S ribosomal protein L22 [bacterium]|nr:50S ribosomal protein L22 [bacterium]
MEARAVAKYVRMSPQKVRKVVELIRGKSVNQAINALHFIPQAASRPVEKILRSAAANAVSREDGAKINPDDLIIREIRVDQGPSMKRNNPGPMGRASMLLKRSAHITVVVTDEKRKKNTAPEAAQSAQAGAKSDAAKGHAKAAPKAAVKKPKAKASGGKPAKKEKSGKQKSS